MVGDRSTNVPMWPAIKGGGVLVREVPRMGVGSFPLAGLLGLRCGNYIVAMFA